MIVIFNLVLLMFLITGLLFVLEVYSIIGLSFFYGVGFLLFLISPLSDEEKQNE